jgi:CheY-like chemotaxis protein
VVHGIVRSHGGAVLVTSEMGKGTTMAVHLPLGEPPAARVEVAENADHPGGEAPVVLVVDDDDDVREVSRLVLERSGMVVVTADGGPNALVEFGQRSGRFDAVLLDLTMPGMPGDAVLAQIREIDPTVPVVLISGYSDLDLQERLRELLVNGFVKKPFRAETLVSTVQRALRNTTG